MKRIIFAVLLGVASINSMSVKAQTSVSINIGQQPEWGPSGYNHVDYYYMPDIDAYYNVPAKQYIYQENGAWVWRNNLPSRYSNYDLYSGYKVVMNKNKPYLSHSSHVSQYSKYKNYQSKQPVIRNSHDNRGGDNGNRNNNQSAKPSKSKPAQINKGNNQNNRGAKNENQRGGNDNANRKGRN
ncbi:hypothetical protein EV200_102256 [Pedobacter psychrotolerans]|uniref:YXWGXW repeat-containing protein n=1 Tax=Pedobacter psychrotolerans TaxID=1843235 RepID=A0A4R2HIT7_9SPHI|nr:hypothetical protein [Pedobacter psychrotolerans]TCO28839.1 hypothetical protein EV200_102256 [Pedobacter psychrotolerans]GGE52146.1 hypothetical protein GCM10011413_18100 [Pedobacter psychrotolerans]